MKDRHIVILFCSVVCFAGVFFACGSKKSGEPRSGPLNSFKRCSYKNLHVVYDYAEDLRGKEELFIADYGKYEARYSKYEILSLPGLKNTDNASIFRISNIYNIDFSEKTIIQDWSGSLDSLYHLDDKDIPSPQHYVDQDMKDHYLLFKGIDTINGKVASRWQNDGAFLTLWVWNSIVVKKHIVAEKGTSDMVVALIDSSWVVDTTKFSIPSGFTNKPKPNAPSAD